MCQFSSSLHPAQRALSCCPVASQLGGSRPGKRNKYQIAQKQTARFCVLFAFVVSGNYLSSRAVASQVLSAYKGLTSVFGMGTGGTPWLNHRNGYGVFSTHLENCIAFQFASIKPSTYEYRSAPYIAALPPPAYQPCGLHGVLLLSDGRSYLEVGFTLRCLQRLSDPHLATQLCRWHDN